MALGCRRMASRSSSSATTKTIFLYSFNAAPRTPEPDLCAVAIPSVRRFSNARTSTERPQSLACVSCSFEPISLSSCASASNVKDGRWRARCILYIATHNNNSRGVTPVRELTKGLRSMLFAASTMSSAVTLPRLLLTRERIAHAILLTDAGVFSSLPNCSSAFLTSAFNIAARKERFHCCTKSGSLGHKCLSLSVNFNALVTPSTMDTVLPGGATTIRRFENRLATRFSSKRSILCLQVTPTTAAWT
mmetsp:Transcript_1900/g.7079  ORF Transcript_1900/g.7079 Transcript_1900/m.7079 type:complete len:248 (+) Transcript_1900:162-905(+)